jgi:hypothetical protein
VSVKKFLISIIQVWKFRADFVRNQKLILINGICGPAVCSSQRLIEFVNKNFLLRADFVGLSAQCQTNDPKSFEAIDYFAM